MNKKNKNESFLRSDLAKNLENRNHLNVRLFLQEVYKVFYRSKNNALYRRQDAPPIVVKQFFLYFTFKD